MEDLITFKRNVKLLGLCDEYLDKWNVSETKRELLDLALDANGVELVCDAQSFGFGMDISYIKRVFGDYINGRYIRNKDGYTSCLYVDFTGSLCADTTITLLLSSNVTVRVPKDFMCKLYVGGGSTVEIHGDGTCYVYSYGENKISGRYKQINYITKSKWKK